MKYLICAIDPKGWIVTLGEDHDSSRAIEKAKLWRTSWLKSEDLIVVLHQTDMGYRTHVRIRISNHDKN